MFEPDQYELLDFGEDRKLERLAGLVLDRPCPAARMPRATPSLWSRAAARFTKNEAGGLWRNSHSLPDPWLLRSGSLVMELRPTEFGQVGLFPEQSVNWEWLQQRLQIHSGARILNLFAYTGASTLAAASSGAEVVHVDAAKNVVAWARRNAEHSGLRDAPIRWIVEDAGTFVRREIKRGHQYDGIILDPPSYGHGPNGETWKLTRDLGQLLKGCRQLLSASPTVFLLSCHTPGFGPAELSATLSDVLFGSCGAGVRTRRLSLRTRDGRKLPGGHAAYWP